MYFPRQTNVGEVVKATSTVEKKKKVLDHYIVSVVLGNERSFIRVLFSSLVIKFP